MQLSIQLFGAKLAPQLKKVRAREARALALDIYNGVKSRTPVGTYANKQGGTAKRGWKKRRLLNDRYEIVNNVAYINVLDLGLYPNPPKSKTANKTVNGYSKKAKKGMTGPTLKNLSKRFKYTGTRIIR